MSMDWDSLSPWGLMFYLSAGVWCVLFARILWRQRQGTMSCLRRRIDDLESRVYGSELPPHRK